MEITKELYKIIDDIEILTINDKEYLDKIITKRIIEEKRELLLYVQ